MTATVNEVEWVPFLERAFVLMSKAAGAGGVVVTGTFGACYPTLLEDNAQEALAGVSVEGYRPRMRAGVHWGRPRKLGGDYLGVDVNIAARVADMGKADQVVVSDLALERLESGGLRISRAKRLRAQGAPRDLRCAVVERDGSAG